jgi:hypothetical protein
VIRDSGLDIYLRFLKCSAASFGEQLLAFRRSSVISFFKVKQAILLGLLDPEDKVTKIIRNASGYL